MWARTHLPSRLPRQQVDQLKERLLGAVVQSAFTRVFNSAARHGRTMPRAEESNLSVRIDCARFDTDTCWMGRDSDSDAVVDP